MDWTHNWPSPAPASRPRKPNDAASMQISEKCLLNNGNPWLEQATLAELMHNGSYAAHLLRVRSHYKDNRDCLITALRRNFGDVRIDGDSGGLHVLWHLPPGIPDAVTVEAIALRARIGVYSLSSARAHFRRQTALTSRAIILGYAALPPKQIEKGIAPLSDAIDDPATDMTALFSDQFGSPAPSSPASAIWPHDFGSNRLYAARHLIVQSRGRSSHQVARQCRFSKVSTAIRSRA